MANALESVAATTLGGAIRSKDMQARLVSLGRVLGKRAVTLMDTGAVEGDPFAGSKPGSWEKEVFSPMLDPLLTGFMQEARGALLLRAGAVGGVAAGAVSLVAGLAGFYLGRRASCPTAGK